MTKPREERVISTRVSGEELTKLQNLAETKHVTMSRILYESILDRLEIDKGQDAAGEFTEILDQRLERLEDRLIDRLSELVERLQSNHSRSQASDLGNKGSLTQAELAKYLDLDAKTLWRWRQKGNGYSEDKIQELDPDNKTWSYDPKSKRYYRSNH